MRRGLLLLRLRRRSTHGRWKHIAAVQLLYSQDLLEKLGSKSADQKTIVYNMRTKKIQWIFFVEMSLCVQYQHPQNNPVLSCHVDFVDSVDQWGYKFNSSSDKSFRKKLFFREFVITKLAIELVKFLKLILLFQKKRGTKEEEAHKIAHLGYYKISNFRREKNSSNFSLVFIFLSSSSGAQNSLTRSSWVRSLRARRRNHIFSAKLTHKRFLTHVIREIELANWTQCHSLAGISKKYKTIERVTEK